MTRVPRPSRLPLRAAWRPALTAFVDVRRERRLSAGDKRCTYAADLMLFSDPTGHPSPDQIIGDFLSVLSARPDADPHRLLNVAGLIAIAVGGEAEHYVPLDAPPHPGTILAEQAAAGRTLPEREWLELLRQRLRELVDDGVDAVFLVRSLAHYVTDLYEQLANTEAAEENRAQTRQGMYETAADPERLRSYRRRMAAQDPEYATKSEDEIANDLRQLADTHFNPLSPEAVANTWGMLDAWQRDVADLLATD